MKQPQVARGFEPISYLERDVPSFGLRIRQNPASLLENACLRQSLARYTDVLVDLMFVRRLALWHSNARKRRVKSPKVYIRDAGLTHALLGIENYEALIGHLVVGGSWEGFWIENLIAAAPRGTQPNYYRSSAGTEIDLLLQLPDGALWAIEIKQTTNPKVARGIYTASKELNAVGTILVYSDEREVPGMSGVRAMRLEAAMEKLRVL